ncbi:MAG: RagB/SusD family nutrient uptake outer membrane protein [Gemmatimonadota bacterium]
MRKRTGALLVAVVAAVAAAGCDLDLQNPNAVTSEEVRTADGIVSLAVGMQGQYATSVAAFVRAPALVTDEWGTNTQSLISYQSLFTGENFDDGYAVVEAPFASAYRVVASANELIEYAPEVGLEAGTATGIVALARLFKAMALGAAVQQYERVPVHIAVESPAPQPREVVLDSVMALLASAESAVDGLTDDDLTTLENRVLGDGFDLRNTVRAMRARFALMAGDHAGAIAAAERVDLGVLSVLSYAAPSVNPIWNITFNSLYVAPLASFVDEAEPGDGRVDYWVDTGAEPAIGNPDSLLLPTARYTDPQDPFPVYLPDEMRLIRAEAHAREGRYPEAARLLNDVRTQTSSGVDEPVAGLDEIPEDELDTEAELLEQIAHERRYELFMQGLRWEDVRRFGAAATTEPTFDFLPLPRQECVANPGEPCS